MNKLVLWIADQAHVVSEHLETWANNVYMLDRLDMDQIPHPSELYDFDDDETQRTSDASFELVVELQTPIDVLAEAMGYTPDELPSGDFRIMLPDDGPNYEADELIDEDGR